MVHSTAPQAVSRYLTSRTWTRSETVRSGGNTQGFIVNSVLGETRVRWVEDSRTPGSPGFIEPTKSEGERFTALAKTLGERYEVSHRENFGEDYLIVSEKESEGP